MVIPLRASRADKRQRIWNATTTRSTKCVMRTSIRLGATWARTVARHWRHVVAATATTIAVARVAIWLAKAVGTIGTLEAMAAAMGYAEAVADFEACVDSVLQTVLTVTQALVDRL